VFSSRTRMGVGNFSAMHNVRCNISRLLARLPPGFEGGADVEALRAVACQTHIDIVELIFRARDAQGWDKDIEFARATMQARWEQGLADAHATLDAEPWLEPAPPEVGVRSFDVLGPR